MRRHVIAVVTACLALALGGCGNGSTTSVLDAATADAAPSNVDAGAPIDSGEPRDTGATPTRCTQEQLDANDRTATLANVVFANNQLAKQYAPSCLTIKVGQKVTFAGNFFEHPLEPKDGELVTPIPPATDTGARLTVTFPNPGTFGFQCKTHPMEMFGAIQVVP